MSLPDELRDAAALRPEVAALLHRAADAIEVLDELANVDEEHVDDLTRQLRGPFAPHHYADFAQQVALLGGSLPAGCTTEVCVLQANHIYGWVLYIEHGTGPRRKKIAVYYRTNPAHAPVRRMEWYLHDTARRDTEDIVPLGGNIADAIVAELERRLA